MAPPPPPPIDAPLRLPPLPADTILEILSRVGDATAVVRCAATCKAWRRLILEPSFLSRGRAGRSDPSPLLGFFFLDTSQKLPRRRLYLRRPTRFLPLGPSQSQATALPLSHFLPKPDAAGLSGFAPVTSGAGGLLALRRSPASSCDLVRICVCDPVAGTSTFLPPLPPTTSPENIVFLDADGSSFRLLAAMDRPNGIRLRVFSSQTRQWGTAVTAQLPGNMVVHLCSPAVVHRGAVHWICGTRALPNALHALAVRPGQADVSVCRFDLPLRAGIHRLNHAAEAVRLFSSAQGCLSLVLLDEPVNVISIWNLEDDSTHGNSWELHKMVHLTSVLPSTILDPSAGWGLSVVALCDQSGSLFLRAVGEGGLFVLNLETEAMSRVRNDHCAKFLCPYVANLSSCLGAMKNF
ncbi:uncharacterized protein LOC119310452 [Triticum dicoccoides]|uniref:uncharacterized protein LOC119310452 n=1 Tax=Triticum dicoccoides TaxID=85692 RepID=UPI001890EF67|nr:uncharacterized protein LOC119310452 [Triticum dicoccoides]